ncbi:NUDIX domain-containing protein [Cellulomonas citrea]|uniref:NUDIX domain-containing protein n=1 Tax=Cellulomonas citrea TaxID=1909423 RepID=UPI00135AEE44|nr:NUDIX domain-containing protein [Cellulomonas citrea]
MPAGARRVDPQGFATAAEALAGDLASWRPADAQTEAWRSDCLDLLLAEGGAALDRERRREHVTASCFVLADDLSHVLLTLHRKIGLWLQLGGHVEPEDASVPRAARREAREESGISGLELVARRPADLERQDVGHALSGCSVHWDLQYVALADRDAPITVSDESDRVEWWPVAHLPERVPVTFQARVERVVREASRLAPR